VLSGAVVYFYSIRFAHKPRIIVPSEMKWSSIRSSRTGCRRWFWAGDPAKEGLYTMRIKVPAGMKLFPHFHPDNRNAVYSFRYFLLQLRRAVRRVKNWRAPCRNVFYRTVPAAPFRVGKRRRGNYSGYRYWSIGHYRASIKFSLSRQRNILFLLIGVMMIGRLE